MNINSDFSRTVSIDCESLPWRASPLPGVERRMLDRVGDELARATSIVRYAPGSHFAAHSHPGGEEFLVLEGVFSDETGDFGPGTYVRNPPGSRHRPFSRDGCVIFVKLMQMLPEDHERRVVDTREASFAKPLAGLSTLPLHQFGAEAVFIAKLEAGAAAEIAFPQGGELLLLAGDLVEAGRGLRALHWMRQAAGATLCLESRTGAQFYLKHGLMLLPQQ